MHACLRDTGHNSFMHACLRDTGHNSFMHACLCGLQCMDGAQSCFIHIYAQHALERLKNKHTYLLHASRACVACIEKI